MPSGQPSCDISQEIHEIACCLKALGHPVRLEMVQQLKLKEMPCCGDICDCFPYSQSTISQHLSVLVEAGLVECRKSGNKSHYRFREEAFGKLIERLISFEAQTKMKNLDRPKD